MSIAQRIAALLVVPLLAACTPLASGTSSSAGTDEGEIRAAGETWNTNWRALNTDGLIALYAPDAVLMPETTQTAKGQAAIRDFLKVYAGLLTEGGYSPVVSNTVDIEISGNLASRSGTYAITEKSGEVVDTGKWLETWRKADGKWLISRQIWNSNTLPLFPPSLFTPR